MGRSGGHDQVVIGNLQFGSIHDAAVEIESGHLGHEDFLVLVCPENRADGFCDLSGRKPGSRDLVQKGLKGMEILAVDHCDLDRRFGQGARGIQPTKSRADDDNSRSIAHDLLSLTLLLGPYLYKIHAMADGSRSSSPAGTAGNALLRWLLPSVADLIFVALLASLLFTPLSVKLLGDAGIGWHIRTGQLILTTHAIPRVDPFSAQSHESWIAWEWLYDVIVGWLDRHAGLNGVVWLTAVVIASVFAGTFRLLLRRGDLLIALLLTLLVMGASMIHFLARSHVLSWLFTLVWFWVLGSYESSSDARANPRIWLLPLLMLIWVNVHGGFLLGFVLLAIFWLGSLGTWLHLKHSRIEESLGKIAAGKRVRALTEVGLLSAAASLVNPYGWHLHEHIYNYLTNLFLMDH